MTGAEDYQEYHGSKAGVSLGTSIVAVTFNGGVILGADSRTSNGSYIANRVQDKITPMCDNVYMLRSGSAADTQAIASFVQHFIAQSLAETGEQMGVRTAANLVTQMAYQNKDRLEAGMIVAGWDKHGGGQVWGIPLGARCARVALHAPSASCSRMVVLCTRHVWRPASVRACLPFLPFRKP